MLALPVDVPMMQRSSATHIYMPDWLSVILLGIVEGLTEFIPVSSTGHLLIAEQWLPRQTDLFNVVIQLGAVLALVPLFWTKLSGMVFGLKDEANRSRLIKIILAFVVTSAAYPVMKKFGIKLPETIQPVAWALLVGGLIMLAVEALSKRRVLDDQVTHTVAVIVGLGQIIAMVFPGASRSGSTIMLAMLFGLSRSASTEFTFMLGIPTMFAASGVKILEALRPKPINGVAVPMEPQNWPMVALGFVVSFIVSFFVVRWLIRYVKGHSFNGFAIYRVLLGGLLFFAYSKGWIIDPPITK